MLFRESQKCWLSDCQYSLMRILKFKLQLLLFYLVISKYWETFIDFEYNIISSRIFLIALSLG